jgi:hypothetical protein
MAVQQVTATRSPVQTDLAFFCVIFAGVGGRSYAGVFLSGSRFRRPSGLRIL